MLVESGGNKEIRDWFEAMDFDDYFKNLDGQETTVKKAPAVSIEKTLKFIDFDESIKGRNSCYNRAISEITGSFKGDFNVILAEDNQFIIKGDIFADYLKILNHFGVESISPLLSEDMISHSFSIPFQYKYDKTKDVGKLSLRKLLSKYHIDRLISNEKLGFNVNTLNLWKSFGKSLCQEYLIVMVMLIALNLF